MNNRITKTPGLFIIDISDIDEDKLPSMLQGVVNSYVSDIKFKPIVNTYWSSIDTLIQCNKDRRVLIDSDIYHSREYYLRGLATVTLNIGRQYGTTSYIAEKIKVNDGSVLVLCNKDAYRKVIEDKLGYRCSENYLTTINRFNNSRGKDFSEVRTIYIDLFSFLSDEEKNTFYKTIALWRNKDLTIVGLG